MEKTGRILRWARCLLLAALWMLLAAWLMPVRAQAAQNNYYYPGYDAASNGDVDLMLSLIHI